MLLAHEPMTISEAEAASSAVSWSFRKSGIQLLFSEAAMHYTI